MLILVVDDEPDVIASIRRALRADTVIGASSALEAVDILAHEPIDLAFVDWNLGGTMTGIDVGRHAPRRCALVMVSGYTLKDIRAGWQDPLGGFLEFIEKPWTLQALRALRDRIEESKEITKP